MKVLLISFILLCVPIFGEAPQKSLRISTWPAGAEVYTGKRPDSFVSKAKAVTPDSLNLSAEDSIVQVTFFKPGYADTTIDIHLRYPGKNFVWIELQEESDLDKLEWQNAIIAKRENRRIGKVLFYSGFVPLALSGAFAGIAEMKFREAEDARDKMEKSIIHESENFKNFQRDFHNEKQSGKHFRTASFVSLGISAVLFAAAAVFYF